MAKRFVAIWFPHLITDWLVRQRPALKDKIFVLAATSRGRMIIKQVSLSAQQKGIFVDMILADARAMFPSLEVLDDKPGLSENILTKIGGWCIRFTPITAIDPPDGLILDISGCAHLWGGETIYLNDIATRFNNLGYHIRLAMADTIGAAWAVARFGQNNSIIEPQGQLNSIMSLPPAALRLDAGTIERMQKLGFYKISSFIHMPRAVLRRRFGQQLLQSIAYALGEEEEMFQPLQAVEAYQERLVCFDPIVNKTGIEIALNKLLEKLCARLKKESRGLCIAVLKCFRLDGKMEQISIGTNHPSNNEHHLFKLFEIKISTIEPDLGIELFVLEASKVEDVTTMQETLWLENGAIQDCKLAELLDKIESKCGHNTIHRFLPAEHYWPERSFKNALSLDDKPSSTWSDRLRPILLLNEPELIKVTAPVPDYPPMSFRYKDKLHRIKKADGPERIEREWWIEQGMIRDYYCVEDEEGQRYWLFRSGHYEGNQLPAWFLHGFFA